MTHDAFTIIDDGQVTQTGEDEGLHAAGRAESAGRPVAVDRNERAAYLGVSARERAERLRSLEAPDFALPDLDGRLHSLGEHRGKKVFLVAYASG